MFARHGIEGGGNWKLETCKLGNGMKEVFGGVRTLVASAKKLVNGVHAVSEETGIAHGYSQGLFTP